MGDAFRRALATGNELTDDLFKRRSEERFKIREENRQLQNDITKIIRTQQAKNQQISLDSFGNVIPLDIPPFDTSTLGTGESVNIPIPGGGTRTSKGPLAITPSERRLALQAIDLESGGLTDEGLPVEIFDQPIEVGRKKKLFGSEPVFSEETPRDVLGGLVSELQKNPSAIDDPTFLSLVEKFNLKSQLPFLKEFADSLDVSSPTSGLPDPATRPEGTIETDRNTGELFELIGGVWHPLNR